MKIFTLFALALCLMVSNGFGEVYPGLKVIGDFRKLSFACEDVEENPLKISTEDVVQTIKLSLLRNGIKPMPDYMIEGGDYVITEWLYFALGFTPIDGSMFFSMRLTLEKYTSDYMKTGNEKAGSYIPHQGDYSPFGNVKTKSEFLDFLRSTVDRFCLDYLESNMP